MDHETAVDLYEPPTSEDSQHQPLTVAGMEAELRGFPATLRVVVRGTGHAAGNFYEAEAVMVFDPGKGEQVVLIKAY